MGEGEVRLMDRTQMSVSDWRDFLEAATPAERQENLNWMRRVFYGTEDPAIQATWSLSEETQGRLVILRKTPTYRQSLPGFRNDPELSRWNSPERAALTSAIAKAKHLPVPTEKSGPALRAMRLRRKLKLREVTRETGISRAVLDRIEYDRYLMPVDPDARTKHGAKVKPSAIYHEARHALLTYYLTRPIP